MKLQRTDFDFFESKEIFRYAKRKNITASQLIVEGISKTGRNGKFNMKDIRKYEKQMSTYFVNKPFRYCANYAFQISSELPNLLNTEIIVLMPNI